MIDEALNPNPSVAGVHLMTSSFAAVAAAEVGEVFDGYVEPVEAVGAYCCLILTVEVG